MRERRAGGRGSFALKWLILIYLMAYSNLDDGSSLRAERW